MKPSKSFALLLIEVHEMTDNYSGVDTDFCLAGGDIVVFAIEGMQ